MTDELKLLLLLAVVGVVSSIVKGRPGSRPRTKHICIEDPTEGESHGLRMQQQEPKRPEDGLDDDDGGGSFSSFPDDERADRDSRARSGRE